jgi:hypothetical protein
MKKEAEERKQHRMGMVHDFLEMLQDSQRLCTTQKDSCAPNIQMTTVRYISDTQEIAGASWSLFPHDCASAFPLSESSPLPPPLSAKDLSGRRTEIINVRQICRINHHPVETEWESAPERIADTEDWINGNGDLDNSNV